MGLVALLEGLRVLGFWFVTGLLGLVLAISGFLAVVATVLLLPEVGLPVLDWVFIFVLLVVTLEVVTLEVAALGLLEVAGLVWLDFASFLGVFTAQ